MAFGKLDYYFGNQSVSEWKDFRNFLNSPFHSNSQVLLELHAELHPKNFHQGELRTNLETLFSRVYPGRAFRLSRLQNDGTLLIKQYEKFLTYQEFQRDNEMKAIFLARAMARKGKDKYLAEKIRKAQEVIEEKGRIRPHYFYLKFEVLRIALSVSDPLSKASEELPYELMEQHISNLYRGFKIMLACLMQGASNVLSFDAGTQALLEKLLEEIEQLAPLYREEFPIYYQVFEILRDRGGSIEVDHLLADLSDPAIPYVSEVEDIYVYLTNFYSRKLNKAREDESKVHIQKIKTVFLAFFQKAMRDGIIPHMYLKNYVSVLLQDEDPDEVYKEVEQYFEYLHQDVVDTIKRYILAIIHFMKGENAKQAGAYDLAAYNYAEANKLFEYLLKQVKYLNVLYELEIRNYLIRIAFERRNEPGGEAFLEAHLEKGRKFISREQKVSDFHRTRYKKFNDTLKKLFKWVLSPPKGVEKKLIALRLKIEGESLIASKRWLLKKIDELLKEKN